MDFLIGIDIIQFFDTILPSMNIQVTKIALRIRRRRSQTIGLVVEVA